MNGRRHQMSRTASTTGTLARLGFAHPDRAAGHLADPRPGRQRGDAGDGLPDGLLQAVGDTADPDQALLGLVRVLESLTRQGDPAGLRGLVEELLGEGTGGTGCSASSRPRPRSSTNSCSTRATGWTRPEPSGIRAKKCGPSWWPPSPRNAGAPRHSTRSASAIGAACCGSRPATSRPRTRSPTCPRVGEALAELAEAALEAALAIAREEYGSGHEQCRLAIIGMGKTGGES